MLLKTTYSEMRDIVFASGNKEHPMYLPLIIELNHHIKRYQETGADMYIPYDSELFDVADEVTD